MTGRIRSIDGLRGIAFLSVLVAHYVGEVPHGLHFLEAGWLGVELFFVLSGFLIGGILLDNRESVTLFRTFYVRRMLRILPPYYATLSAVFIISAIVGAAAWRPGSLSPLAYLTFTQNIVMAIRNQLDGLWLLPMWTLAVEEQFYLLLPPVIVFTPKRFLPAVVVAAALSGPIMRAVILYLSPAHVLGAYTLLPCRWDALLMGVIAALIYRNPALFERLCRSNFRLLLNVTLVPAWSIAAFVFIDRRFHTHLFDIIGFSSAALCFGAVILLLLGGMHWRDALEAKWLRFFGTISYTGYLIHQPINVLLHGVWFRSSPDIATFAQILVTAFAASVTVGVAYLSWTFCESKIIAFGQRFPYEYEERAIVPSASHGSLEVV